MGNVNRVGRIGASIEPCGLLSSFESAFRLHTANEGGCLGRLGLGGRGDGATTTAPLAGDATAAEDDAERSAGAAMTREDWTKERETENRYIT